MKTNATHFKNHLEEYMLKVYQQPIIVEKSGKPSAVLISYDVFQKFSYLEDLYWGLQAQQAAKEGFLGPTQTVKKLKEYAKKAGITIQDKDKKACVTQLKGMLPKPRKSISIEKMNTIIKKRGGRITKFNPVV